MTELYVNGRAVTVDADPATPLLYVLRNDIGNPVAKESDGTSCGRSRLRIRRIPDLHVQLDDTAERGTRILQMLAELETGSIPAVTPAETAAAEGLWDPVPVTLPTYVSKPPARRSVRTIDLDSTGVWTSGRTESDSAIAREAEAAERVRRRTSRKPGSGEEAVGS